ncbi:MAG: DUF2344 domain-containing protein [Blautia sp.]|nr:DUF2344 domain-containing protein [Blautia sp.]
MKVRIKFQKIGPVKFVGHLDTMRYFQKALRRAGLPVAFSGGYSPHMIMSFAIPLGVGTETKGDYFDLELTETRATSYIKDALESQMAEGFQIVSVRQVEDGKTSSAMSLVAAADYEIQFRPGKEPAFPWQEHLASFLGRSEIPVNKKTKRGEKEVDIRPYIYDMHTEKGGLFMKLASASANYTKPELVLDTFFKSLNLEILPFSYCITRLELYALKGKDESEGFITLEGLGEEIE